MFVPLKISIEEIEILQSRRGEVLLPDIKKECDIFYKGILDQVTEGGVINGSNLAKLNFPFDSKNYDIFISYSHDDEELALYLCAYLRKQGLKCFLDSILWHSADNLLKEIDRNYSRTDDNRFFDYRKRNYSTSHVHAMLSMAMLDGILRSECYIFIDSENSVSLKEGIEYKTLSPWIYEEISFARNCQISIPERYRKPSLRMFCEGGQVEVCDTVSRDLQIEYMINISEFQSIKWSDIYEKYGTGMLDSIYRKYGIIPKIRGKLYG